jgi:uncharacterized OsmC-like protein
MRMHSFTDNTSLVSLQHLQGGDEQDSSRGKAVFNVSTVWQGGLKSEAICNASVVSGKKISNTGHRIYSDEPEILGGGGSAPGPQELLLAAFNACLTASYVAAAKTENVQIEKLTITTSGELDVSAFLGFSTSENPVPEKLRYVINVSGSGSVAQFEKIHQAVIATSPNRWIIGKGILIEGDQVVE